MELLDAPIAITNQSQARCWDAGEGRVDFRDVSFSYLPGKPALGGCSFTVAAGEFVAIAGGRGSGKGTLLNLVPRFYDTTGGSVLVDGRHAELILSCSEYADSYPRWVETEGAGTGGVSA
ncbi:MAG: hypothetical protein RLZZ622_562 [Planctomycetota bacterium]|jgi:ATP-binding cassette subfamily B protein